MCKICKYNENILIIMYIELLGHEYVQIDSMVYIVEIKIQGAHRKQL